MIFLIPKDALVKHYFAYKENNVNILEYKTFLNTIFYSIIMVYSAIRFWNGFR
jgi:hypothetical protein